MHRLEILGLFFFVCLFVCLFFKLEHKTLFAVISIYVTIVEYLSASFKWGMSLEVITLTLEVHST